MSNYILAIINMNQQKGHGPIDDHEENMVYRFKDLDLEQSITQYNKIDVVDVYI